MSWRNPVNILFSFSVTAFAAILSKGTQASAVVGAPILLTNTNLSTDNLPAKWLLQINLLLPLPSDFRDWKDFNYQFKNFHFNPERAKENWRISLTEFKSQKWKKQEELFSRASQTHLIHLQVPKMDILELIIYDPWMEMKTFCLPEKYQTLLFMQDARTAFMLWQCWAWHEDASLNTGRCQIYL